MLAGHRGNVGWTYNFMLMDNVGNMAVLYRISHTSFLQRNNALCHVDSDGNILLNFSQSEKTKCPMSTMLLSNRDEMTNLYRGHALDVSCQDSVYFAKLLDENNFRNHPTRNKNSLWLSCLLTDQDEMSNLHRGSSIDVC